MRSTTRAAAFSTILALALVLTASPVKGQTFGDIYGSIADEEGTRLPGATVTLTGVGAPQITVTDDQGEYRFLNLDPGDYSIKADLDGYATVEQTRVVVALNRNTTIHFTLTSAIEDTVTVTSESPLLDERRYATGAGIGQLELQTIPTARDPWAVMNQTPGVLVDRINVGGSESGAQSVFIGQGSGFFDNDWLMDGIQITDAVQGGSPTTYFDFEQFESIDLSTGGPDVTKNTPGVSVNLVTRRGTNEFRGTARFLSAKQDGLGFLGQSSSDFECSELADSQDCDSFEVNQVDDITEYGFEAGGAAIQDRLWLWGSYGISDIDRQATGGSPFSTNLENVSVKANIQIATNNSGVASWNNGNKTVAGRDSGPTRAEETTRDQRGPTAFWRLEDTHIFGSSLYMNGSYQKIDGGFQLKPRSGCLDTSCSLGQETLWDSDGVWKQNWFNGFARRPEDVIKLDGSYFFRTGELGHELKFGGRYRAAQGFSNFNWPGRNIVHVAGENFGSAPGPADFFFLSRQPMDAEVEVDYASLWLQDTLTMGNWTFNVGLRYDLQGGTNQPGSTGVSVTPEVFPEVTLDKPLDAGFDWESITPRIGATYALGEDRDTLLRASFSQFPRALAAGTVAHVNPLLPGSGSYAYFLFFDDDDDNQFRGDESYVFLFGSGYDDQNPTTNWNTVDPGFDPEITSEAILGVEHSLRPEFVIGLSYTWREVDDVAENRLYVRPEGTSGRGFTATADDYVLDSFTSATLPDGTESSQPVFRLDPSLELSGGFSHLQNGSRSREYNGVSLTATKRLANRWSLRGFLNWGETEWSVPAEYLANSDPTDDIDTADNDGGLFMVDGGGGRLDVYLQSTWQWSLTGIYQVAPDRPWGFNLAANLYGREGYVIPYNNSVSASDGIARTVSHVGGAVDRFRNDDITTVDLRAEKTFGLSGDVNLTFGLDLFNALNDATVLARATTLNRATADWVQDVISPRIWKLGVRVGWK